MSSARPMRRPIVAGNWKCHKTSTEGAELAEALRAHESHDVEMVVCPPFTALAAVAGALRGSSISWGGQDVFWESSGAFTGEVSAPMLVELGCRYVIIGHSERRQHFGETDESVHRKLLAALAHPLTPIVCVGETLAQRDAGQTFDVIGRQLDGALAGVSNEQVRRIVLAYEPVWAIGTGRTATPAQAQEVHATIRRRLSAGWKAVADGVRIQYGGSVTPANALELLQQPDVDGALVGGASLKPDSFSAIINAAAQAKVKLVS